MSVSIKDNKETSIINIVIEKKDYEDKVSSILNDYRKRANIPGFRKGFVPMGMIKKQYEIPVKVDEINKVVQKKLSEFIDENKISLLGTPIPIENEKIDLTFSLGHLNRLCMTSKLTDEIEMNLSDNSPMKINYSLGENSHLTFHIAPKINDF